MIRKVSRGKHNQPTQSWQNPLSTQCHVAIPQFQVTAVGFLPIGIQKDKDIDSSVQLQLIIPVEISVNIEIPTGSRHMETGTRVVRIRDQSCDIGEAFEEGNKGGGLEVTN